MKLCATQAAKDAAARQKVAALISIVGKNTYAVLKDLSKLGKPSDKTYAQLCDLMKDHYQPKTIEVAETFKFHRCHQQEGEAINSFSACLRGLASTCNFGTFLARALRDQFVSGIKSREIQKKLLESNKTFDECIAAANADEMASRETFSIMSPEIEVKYVCTKKGNKASWKSQKSTGKPQPYSCYSCRKTDHKRDECKFRNATCHACKRKGLLLVIPYLLSFQLLCVWKCVLCVVCTYV